MFKLAPAAQEFSICLRCQFRLSLGRLTRRRPLQAASHPIFCPRSFTSHSRRRQEDAQLAHTDDSSRSQPIIRYEPFDNGPAPNFKDPPPKSPLGVESMGGPAEVLVLRSTPKAARNLGVLFIEEPAKPLPTSLERTSGALLHGIDAERGIIGLDQVCANVDRVRDSFLESRGGKMANVSAEAYDELVLRLRSGFKKKHLAEYWRRSGSKANADALNLHFPYSSALFARSAWALGTTPLNHAKPPPLMDKGDIQKGATQGRLSLLDKGKHWHAENIVRRCWGLHREQVDTAGELILRLQPKHLELLLNHSSDPLKKLSQTYSVTIEASKKEGVIRLESDFSTCEDVVRMFTHILERIESTAVSTGVLEAKTAKVVTKAPDDAYLQEVGKLTNTIIVKPACQRSGASPSPREYTVYYLGPDESDLEDARRLLNVNMNADMTKQSGNLFIQVPVPSKTSAIPVDFGHSLPLAARSTQWARFTSPNARQSGIDTEPDSSPIETSLGSLTKSGPVLDKVTEFLSKRGEMHIKKKLHGRTYQHWETTLSRWSRVVLGQIGFPLQQALKAESELRNAKTYDDLIGSGIHQNIFKLQKAFVTTVPRMTRVLEADTTSMLPAERLRIRMLPAPTPGLPLAVMDRVPQLEILVNIHAKVKTISLRTARLVLLDEELDLLLPSHTTDLRFMRRVYIYCNREDFDPSLTAFVQASNLDIWGSERLRTPNDLRLSIPASSIPGIEEHIDLPDGSLVPIDFKFASLEHRSDLNLPLLGTNKPQYNTIEAGRTGGRREELAINLGRSADMRTANLLNIDTEMETDVNRRKQMVAHRQSAKGLLEAASTMIETIESHESEWKGMSAAIARAEATELREPRMGYLANR